MREKMMENDLKQNDDEVTTKKMKNPAYLTAVPSELAEVVEE